MTPSERLFNVLKKPWFIGIYIVLIVLVYYFVDKPVAIYFHQLDLRTNLTALKIFTLLGQWQVNILLFFLAGLYFRYIQKNNVYEERSWYLLGCVLIPNILGFIIKICLSRARPDLLFDSNIFGFYWFQSQDAYWSLPSGHAVTSLGLAFGLAILFPRYFYAFFCLAIFICLTRVFLYKHYISDVMAGSYFSILVAGWFTDILGGKHYLKNIR